MLVPTVPCNTECALMWTDLVHQPALLLPGAAALIGGRVKHGHRRALCGPGPWPGWYSCMLRLPCNEAHVALSFYWWGPSCFLAAAGDAWHGRSTCGHVGHVRWQLKAVLQWTQLLRVTGQALLASDVRPSYRLPLTRLLN